MTIHLRVFDGKVFGVYVCDSIVSHYKMIR